MKAMIRSAVVTVAIAISALACHGQCYMLQAHTVSCTGPNNCSQTVAVNQAIGNEMVGMSGISRCLVATMWFTLIQKRASARMEMASGYPRARSHKWHLCSLY